MEEVEFEMIHAFAYISTNLSRYVRIKLIFMFSGYSHYSTEFVTGMINEVFDELELMSSFI